MNIDAGALDGLFITSATDTEPPRRSRLNGQADRLTGSRQDPMRIKTLLNEIYSERSHQLHSAWQQLQAAQIDDLRWES